MKKALVLGAGGFIGHHLVKDLERRGYFVRGVDLVLPAYEKTYASDFVLGDLRNWKTVSEVFDTCFDEVFQLAANMGGAGFIFTGENDAAIFHDNAQINLNVAKAFKESKSQKLFFSSSACVYPRHTQTNLEALDCSEQASYPADPDSDYGWEKLFGERLFQSFRRNYHLDIKIGRFHNVYGELSTWRGGREKAPAAICRKVIEARDGDTIELWGDGNQTRSFLYISDCLRAIESLMASKYSGPYNIGSEEMVTIRELAQIIVEISGKSLKFRSVSGPEGVRHRNSNNKQIRQDLGWSPVVSIREGHKKLHDWIETQTQLTLPFL